MNSLWENRTETVAAKSLAGVAQLIYRISERAFTEGDDGVPYIKAKDGADIYYESHGEGPACLFLSETACNGEVWKIYQVPEFSRDHRVIIVDYRGNARRLHGVEPQLVVTQAPDTYTPVIMSRFA
jgi:hypothetical protein